MQTATKKEYRDGRRRSGEAVWFVALISHGHSWTVPTRRANNCCHTAHAAPFLADTVWQSHSLSSSVSVHAERNAHARLRSPCAFRSASSDEQRGGLGLCQTHARRIRGHKTGAPTPRKGVRYSLVPSYLDGVLPTSTTCVLDPINASRRRCKRGERASVRLRGTGVRPHSQQDITCVWKTEVSTKVYTIPLTVGVACRLSQ